MFKKFDHLETKNNIALMKNKVSRDARNSVLKSYPALQSVIADLWPAKKGLKAEIMKCQDKVNIILINSVPLFYNHRDGQYVPTLRLLHTYPDLLPRQTTDRGAIKFVLQGANIMCPGLTHKNAILDTSIENGTYVSIYAEGKDHAMAIGIHVMSGKEIQDVNKGIGINLVHYLNDGLWHMDTLA